MAVRRATRDRSVAARADERHRRGRDAEAAVASWFREQGFEIVATNHRVGRLELDVVARKGSLVVVVEVRTRGPGSWTHALGSIDAAKRQRIRRAGELLWQRRFRHDEGVDRIRFDAASVTFRDGVPEVEYVPAAF